MKYLTEDELFNLKTKKYYTLEAGIAKLDFSDSGKRIQVIWVDEVGNFYVDGYYDTEAKRCIPMYNSFIKGTLTPIGLEVSDFLLPFDEEFRKFYYNIKTEDDCIVFLKQCLDYDEHYYNYKRYVNIPELVLYGCHEKYECFVSIKTLSRFPGCRDAGEKYKVFMYDAYANPGIDKRTNSAKEALSIALGRCKNPSFRARFFFDNCLNGNEKNIKAYNRFINKYKKGAHNR